MPDFFISYTSSDEKWAEWIAWTLEAAGYTTTVQKWDFGAGGNFVVEMQRAAAEAKRTIAVLSPDYLKSRFAASEWTAAFAQDPKGERRTLVPVRVRECSVDGLLKAAIYIDLVGLDEDAAEPALLDRLKPGRAKPTAKPAFPGKGRQPAFPGAPRETNRTPADAAAARARYMPKIRGAATDRDKRRFMKEAFETIREHFEQALAELGRQDPRVEGDFTLVDATRFIAEIFVDGESRARCKIWQGGLTGGADGISFREGDVSLDDTSTNEILTLAEDQGALALRAMMNMGFGRADEGLDVKHLSPADAAEYLWRRFCWSFER
jgi:hypothetical protein